MTGSAKRKTLILLGLVLIITVMIAASLPQLELQPGMPLPQLVNNQVVIAPIEEEPAASVTLYDLFKTFLILVFVGILLFVVYRTIQGANWRDFEAYIRPILIIGLVLGGFFLAMLLRLTPLEFDSLATPVPTPPPPVTSPLGEPPPLLLWLVGFILLAIIILMGIWLFRSRSNEVRTIDLVGLEAEKAWQALKTGLDLKDVIIKCYRQMSLALEKEQGIERKDFMTTGEFENLLEAAGVPHDPIHQLTRLFEAVRYGNWQPNPGDEQKAIHCLEAIMVVQRLRRRQCSDMNLSRRLVISNLF